MMDKILVEEKLKLMANRRPQILGHKEYLKTAVLLPLVEYQNNLCILFEKRAADLNVQPGEICFPGGQIEAIDQGAKEAAVRETCEELGLDTGDIEVVAPLDIFVSPFNLIVNPFVGRIKDYQKIKINSEVEYVFYVPLNYLLKIEPPCAPLGLKLVLPQGYPYDLIPHGRNYPYRDARYPQYFYLWEKEVIWGLTARILNHFLDLLQSNQEEIN
ncbi:NUDIX hydrolase [Syntrophomonas wolfei]|uniref:Nudix hydrolase domain-containing protein n=1 Tax=Syntrophomonas wolfei subsp. wolfei (strain DSM 2245B / Goettingen) TaxID=335541 RepID=Q0AY58_SYNWW|nr:CoA pyrophosphatase [Syntrophomonas wolfei]ABI68346.1 conserved hypothetical protein [Syntrophomonas wolfei subsp. wolfei str. Goettingen G311]